MRNWNIVSRCWRASHECNAGHVQMGVSSYPSNSSQRTSIFCVICIDIHHSLRKCCKIFLDFKDSRPSLSRKRNLRSFQISTASWNHSKLVENSLEIVFNSHDLTILLQCFLKKTEDHQERVRKATVNKCRLVLGTQSNELETSYGSFPIQWEEWWRESTLDYRYYEDSMG